jgi:hypothetical protein
MNGCHAVPLHLSSPKRMVEPPQILMKLSLAHTVTKYVCHRHSVVPLHLSMHRRSKSGLPWGPPKPGVELQVGAAPGLVNFHDVCKLARPSSVSRSAGASNDRSFDVAILMAKSVPAGSFDPMRRHPRYHLIRIRNTDVPEEEFDDATSRDTCRKRRYLGRGEPPAPRDFVVWPGD